MVKISYDQEKIKVINFVIPAVFLAAGVFMIIDGFKKYGNSSSFYNTPRKASCILCLLGYKR